MISTILGAFRVPEIRKKVLITFALLGLYRLGAYIPAPAVNTGALKSIQQAVGGSGVLGLLNTFSGGALSRVAIFGLGITPYITASIVLQILPSSCRRSRSSPRRARWGRRGSRSTRAT